MKASVIMTTKNRCEDLRNALASCEKQTTDHELLVIDDGSTDGTSEMVRLEFPRARLIRHEKSGGLIRRRNEAAELATGDILFSIDDDAEFSTPNVIEQTLADFDDPRIAVVAIPLVEPRLGERRLQFAPDDTATWVTDNFKGTSFAMRRDIFLEIGAFRADLVHQGEETDLAIRLLDRGYVIRNGRSDHITHYESPKRDLRRTHFYGRRNDILFAFRNVPARSFAYHALGTTVNGLRATLKARQATSMAKGILFGWIDGLRMLETRTPVRQDTYDRYRKLRRSGSLRMQELLNGD